MEENELAEFMNHALETFPEQEKIVNALYALIPKLFCLFRDDPKMVEIDSFIIAGRDENGDVHVGCWELTSDMLEDLFRDMMENDREIIGKPRRSQ